MELKAKEIRAMFKKNKEALIVVFDVMEWTMKEMRKREIPEEVIINHLKHLHLR